MFEEIKETYNSMTITQQNLKSKSLRLIGLLKPPTFFFPQLLQSVTNTQAPLRSQNGYVVEFSRDGEAFNVSDSVVFEKYSSEDILEKFKSEAISKSIKNKGILIPAHLVDASNLRNLGPVAWEF